MINDNIQPVNIFANRLSSEDQKMIDGMVMVLKEAHVFGDDISFYISQALKRMGRYDLVSPCDRAIPNTNSRR